MKRHAFLAAAALFGAAFGNPVRPMVVAKVARAKADLQTLSAVLDSFRLDCDRYPTTSEGIRALIVRPIRIPRNEWRGPYLSGHAPMDPWHHPYIYRETRGAFDLWSSGGEGSGMIRLD